jgi:FtsZ-interacting cell division protein ZipA
MNAGLVVLIVIVVVALAVFAVLMSRRRRTEGLRERFGPEYERTMARAGDRRAAESDLAEREHRRKELAIVPLEPAAQARYQQEWRATQARFVDDPPGATRDADLLVTRVMQERGYPVDADFERQAADVSVDHPQVVENYRAAHAVYRANEQGLAGTDDLRQAFVHYRSLFSELLDVDRDDREEAHQ